MLRRFWRAETGIFLAIWLGLLLAGRSSLLRDPGTFWHVVVGETILDTGDVVRADRFSFTRNGEPWVAHQWLAECGMAAIHRLAGWDGLMLATVTILAGVYTWLAHRLLRAGFHPLWAAAVLAVVLLAGSHQFHIRPLIFSIGLFALTFAMLVDVDSGRRKLRCLWWLPPLFAVWANLHAGVLAAIATAGLCVAWWCVAWMLGGQSPFTRPRDALAAIAVMIAGGLAVLINPYGIALPRAWFATLALPLPELIQEHAPISLAEPVGWTTALLGAGYLAALLGAFPGRPRVTWLLPLLWLVLACQRVRNVPLFSIAAAVALAEVLPYTRWAARLRQREVLLPVDENRPRHCGPAAFVLPAVLVLAAAAIQLCGVSAPVFGRGWARFDPALWPVELLDELKQIERSGSPGAPTPLFNDLALGGFVIYHAPRLRVFIDDRCALYGSEFLLAYDRARRKDPRQIDRWQRQYGFRHALVKTGTQFDRYLEAAPAWQLVRRSPAAALYRRQ